MNPITPTTRIARTAVGGLLLAALTAILALGLPADSAHADAGEVTTIATSDEPRAVAPGADGTMWAVGGSANSWVARYDADGALLGSWPLAPGSNPRSLTLGPDGRMWIAYANLPTVATVTDAGVVSEYAAPDDRNDAMIVGPDGHLWFASGSRFAIMDIGGAVIADGPLPGSASDLVVGGDGRVWANDSSNDLLNAIDPITGGVTSYPASALPANGMATAPDGNVAVTMILDQAVDIVGADGTVVDTITTPHTLPNYVAYDDAGTMWVTYQSTGTISARMSDGTWIDYPSVSAGNGGWRIAVADDGTIWTADTVASTLRRVTPWSTPTLAASAPAAIVGGAYSFAASAGAATTTLTAGALPDGLTLDEATGVISGTPTAVGSWSATLEATSPAGTATRIFAFTVTVAAVPPASGDGPELADTGARTDGLLALALLSVALGGVALIVARRRTARV